MNRIILSVTILMFMICGQSYLHLFKNNRVILYTDNTLVLCMLWKRVSGEENVYDTGHRIYHIILKVQCIHVCAMCNVFAHEQRLISIIINNVPFLFHHLFFLG